MADVKASPLDRLYLVGAIHRMGERTGAAAERILDDLDTLLAENAKLRAVAEDGRELLREVSEVYRDPPACGVVAGINIGEIREFLAATDTPKEAP